MSEDFIREYVAVLLIMYIIYTYKIYTPTQIFEPYRYRYDR